MLHCHAGCSIEAILGALELKKADLFPPSSGNGKREVVATYDYCDEQGAVLFQVCRTVPKGFFQRRPDGKGGWINNVGNTRKVPFHLPQLLAADPSEPVFIVEGEKDVLALEKLGLVATCNPGGTGGRWRAQYSEFLRDRTVVLLPDNDPPGEKHVEVVLESIHRYARQAKVVRLPGLSPKGDVSDWIANGGDRVHLLQLVEETPPERKPVRPLPEILTSHRQLREITQESLDALYARNKPPRLFVRGGVISRVRQDERGRPIIEELSAHALRGEMERTANFLRVTRDGLMPVAPPMDMVQDVQARPGWEFPPLEAVIQAPVLRTDGSILDQGGYDRATCLLYWPADGLEIPPIPETPSPDDIASAMHLVGEAIQDFPFVDDASRANTLGLFLTPVVRPAIRGPVPLAVCDAPQKGTGKSLLAEVAGTIAVGRAEHMGGPNREEEWQKLITATLVEGNPFVTLDNLRGTIRSAALERVLTAEHWADRVLGHTKMARLPQRATWVATANNARLGGDLARRCYWIRLDARSARPWTRTEFQHPHLLGLGGRKPGAASGRPAYPCPGLVRRRVSRCPDSPAGQIRGVVRHRRGDPGSRGGDGLSGQPGGALHRDGRGGRRMGGVPPGLARGLRGPGPGCLRPDPGHVTGKGISIPRGKPPPGIPPVRSVRGSELRRRARPLPLRQAPREGSKQQKRKALRRRWTPAHPGWGRHPSGREAVAGREGCGFAGCGGFDFAGSGIDCRTSRK